MKSARDFRLLLKFYKILKGYDIVNFHTNSPWAFLAAVLARKKIIFIFHGALGLRTFFKIPITRLFMKHIFIRRCNIITFASKSSLKHFIAGYGDIKSKDVNLEIFPYGLIIDNIKPCSEREFIREKLGLLNKFLIGTAVRMVQVKRPDLLIIALSQLKPREEFSLILMGSGDDEYELYLRGLVKKACLDKNVHFLGYRSDAIDIINALDVFVMPSRREPFGLALLEAMALGVPAIAFRDGGGTVDIIGDSGIVVSDVEELSRAIELLKNDTTLRKNKGEAGKIRARQFDISKTAEILFSIYQKIYSRHTR
jgi:glycosyltransferase involved in cell wall biosynthesis